ncbi:hypothetical protein K435DRAFT_611468, partial [Dendrothele bispora CBS 962.96]
AEEAERQREKRKKEAEREKGRKEKETNDAVRRLTQTQTSAAFSGNIKSKNKTECGDIANALGIVTNGVLSSMRDQILQHFEVNPDLKTNPRYVGLF